MTNVTGMRNYFNLKDVFDGAYVNAVATTMKAMCPLIRLY